MYCGSDMCGARCLRAVVRARLLQLGLGRQYKVVVEPGVPVEHVDDTFQGELKQQGRIYAYDVGGSTCSACDSRLWSRSGKEMQDQKSSINLGIYILSRGPASPRIA